LIIVIFSNISPYFLDSYNILDASADFSEKAILALSMTLLIVCGEIDLSIASIIAVTSLSMGLAANKFGLNTPGLIFVSLAVGALLGFINGYIVTKFKLSSMIVTIGTMSLYRGIASGILGNSAITHYPESFTTLGQDYLWETIPLSLLSFCVLTVIFAIVLHKSTFGRKLFALGSNSVAAKYSGVRADKIKIALFVLSGVLAGLVSVYLTSRLGSTRPNIAYGMELGIVTMVVLGGVSITGGKGTIAGVFIACLVLGFLTYGLRLVNIPGIIMTIFIGGLLIASISIPVIIQRVKNYRERDI
ncbi:MAG: ABC transporter permease, partial [Chlamydiae bacterium]